MNPLDEGPIGTIQKFYNETVIERGDSSESTGVVDKNQLNIEFVVVNVITGDKGVRITPATTQWDFYIRGTKHTIINTLQISCDTVTSGRWYVYIDGDKILKHTDVWSDMLIRDVALLAIYSLENTEHILLQTRPHGMVMDWATHSFVNVTFGVMWEDGLEVTPFSPLGGDGSSDDHHKIVVSNGTTRYADVYYDHPIGTQQLSPHLETYCIHRIGAELGDTIRDTPLGPGPPIVDFPGYWSIISTTAYSSIVAGNWTYTAVPDGKYINSFIFAGCYKYHGIYCMPAYGYYETLEEAKLGAITEVDIITANLPERENILLAICTFKHAIAHTNSTGCSLYNIMDLRKGKNIEFQEHRNQTNLNADDHLQYKKLDGRAGEDETIQGSILMNGTASTRQIKFTNNHDATDYSLIEHFDNYTGWDTIYGNDPIRNTLAIRSMNEDLAWMWYADILEFHSAHAMFKVSSFDVWTRNPIFRSTIYRTNGVYPWASQTLTAGQTHSENIMYGTAGDHSTNSEMHKTTFDVGDTVNATELNCVKKQYINDAVSSNIYNTIHSNGVVSFPRQSSMKAYRGTNQTVNFTAGNATYIIIFNTSIYDIQSEYNTTTGIFTAKEPGIYSISSTVRFTDTNGSLANLYLQTFHNNSTINTSHAFWNNVWMGANTWESQVTTNIVLASADTIDIRLFARGIIADVGVIVGGYTITQMCIHKLA